MSNMFSSKQIRKDQKIRKCKTLFVVNNFSLRRAHLKDSNYEATPTKPGSSEISVRGVCFNR